jgi:pentatricopeptide repeat protein
VHIFFLRSPFCADLRVNNKLLQMYAKCVAMPHTHRTFDIMPDRDMDSWHTMIDGYSVNGLGDEALRLFELMKECMAPMVNSEAIEVISANMFYILLIPGSCIWPLCIKLFFIIFYIYILLFPIVQVKICELYIFVC